MTEKTVAYYEELVRQEISDKTLSFGSKLLYCKIDHTYLGRTVNEHKVQINKDGAMNNSIVSVTDYDIQKYKILGHEIRPHHISIRCGEMWGISFCMQGNFIWIERLGKVLATIVWNLSKPFSEQSDETKIALGKVVEEVLSFKDK